MKIITKPPIPALAGYVRHYWAVYAPLDSICPEQHIFPGINHALVVQVGPKANIQYGSEQKRTRDTTGFLEGIFDTRFTVDLQPNTWVYGVSLNPTGVLPLLRSSIASFSNEFTDVISIFGERGTELIETVHEAVSFEQVAIIFDRFLMKSIDFRAACPAHVLSALSGIAHNAGTKRISSLSEIACVSERKLQRDFKTWMGISAERFSNLVRFKTAYQSLLSERIKSISEFCHDLGYYDESHFIRDLKRNTGLRLDQLVHDNTKIAQELI